MNWFMKIPNRLALEIQMELYNYAVKQNGVFLSDYTGFDLYCGIANLNYNFYESWQISVDLYYRLMLCGFIRKEWNSPDTLQKKEDIEQYNLDRSLLYIRQLALCAPENSNNAEEHHLWSTVYYVASDYCVEFVNKYNVYGHEYDWFSPELIQEIEQVFEKNNVPWSDKPLIPIEPNYHHKEGEISKFIENLLCCPVQTSTMSN